MVGSYTQIKIHPWLLKKMLSPFGILYLGHFRYQAIDSALPSKYCLGRRSSWDYVIVKSADGTG